jgi:hypothetical protein
MGFMPNANGDSAVLDAIPATGTFRMVAIDLDGTLLRSDKMITGATADTIAECTRRGVHVVLASARPPRSVREIHEKLGLQTLSIHYNGALIHHMPTRKHLHHQPMCNKLAAKMVKFARKVDDACLISVEILDKWYTDRYDANLIPETGRSFKPDFIGPIEAFLTVPITKLMILAPAHRLVILREKLHDKFGRTCMMAASDDFLLQISHHEVDKGRAIARVASHYGIEQSQVMAIGDAPNDAAMLKWAGLGVAVANAWPEAKKCADVIAPSNDEEGVAVALRKYVLG